MSSKRSKKDGDTKAEGDGDKKKSKSKKKEKSSKDAKEPKEPKEKAAPPTTTTPAPVPPPTLVDLTDTNDPDAIQLFRRYDREKANHITRSDFLDLLRDYTTWYPGRKWNMPVMPCALTDAAGIPLGFERTSRNSEFEAGQLFERYDANRSGTLEASEFQRFFKDFKKQLAPFVEEMLAAFHATSPPSRTPLDASSGFSFHRHHPSTSFGDVPATHSWPSPPAHHPQRVFDSRHLYETKLSQLHALCDSTLRHLHDKMDNVQFHRKSAAPAWSATRPAPTMMHEDGRDRREWKHHHAARFDEIATDNLQKDIDVVDRIFKDTTMLLDQPHRVTVHDMTAFLDDFPRMHKAVQDVAATTHVPPPSPLKSTAPNDDLEKLLKVKDQMIWGLLQERNDLRRQRDAIDAQLRHMTDLSAHEMRKWAKLTDDMQAEIERLRG